MVSLSKFPRLNVKLSPLSQSSSSPSEEVGEVLELKVVDDDVGELSSLLDALTSKKLEEQLLLLLNVLLELFEVQGDMFPP